jgi:hypothetical protein
LGYYLLHTKDAELCIEAVADTTLAELAPEKTEGLAYALKDPFTAENAVRAI